MMASCDPPDKTMIAGVDVVPDRVTVSAVATRPLLGDEISRVSTLVAGIVPFSSGTEAFICRIRLADQTVTEKRIPIRNPISPAEKIDGPKRLLKKAGIS